MDLSAAQQQLLHHHYQQQQEMMQGSQSLDSIIASSEPAPAEEPQPQQQQDKKPRPPDNEAQRCPRCDSTNTKFCYYNNYSLTQPRYFCKSCRRYWTKGGTLRNVPVGGGCRKSSSSSSSSIKRPSSPSPSSFSSSMFKRAHNHDAMMAADPSLFATLQHQLSGGLGLGFDDCNDPHGASFLRSGAFLDHHNNASSGGGLFNSLCYGGTRGVGNTNSVSGITQDINVGVNMQYEDAATTGGAVTAMKHEGVMSGTERAMWGFPWQLNYGDLGGAPIAAAGGGGHVEPPMRGGWNGLMANSAWHALLNTTPAAALM